MANLTVATPRPFAIEVESNEIPLPQAAENTLEGSALGDKSSLGNARTLVAADNFLGFAVQSNNNSAGTDGSVTILVKDKGLVDLVVTSASTVSIGASVYASDGNTFTAASSGNSKIGVIRRKIPGVTNFCTVAIAGVGRKAG